MRSRELPIELVEKIIDAASIHGPALLACNVVCHAWLPRARWHLYHKIRLSLREVPPIRAARFARTAHDAPHVAAIVDTLHLLGPPREYRHHEHHRHTFGPLATGFDPAPDSHARKWYTVLRLEQLISVRALHISLSALERYEDLLMLLAFFPRLDHLELSHFQISESWDAKVAARVEPILQQTRCISSLDLSFSHSVFPLIIAGCAPGRLFARVARLDIHNPYQSDTRGEWLRLPALLRGTLQDLSVSVTNTPRERAQEAPHVVTQKRIIQVAQSIRGCAALRSLLIRYDIMGEDNVDLRAAPFIAFARELSPLPAFRELALFMPSWSVNALCPVLTELSPALAEALDNRARFPAFARVVVRVMRGYGDSATIAAEAARVRAALAVGFSEDSHVEIAVDVL